MQYSFAFKLIEEKTNIIDLRDTQINDDSEIYLDTNWEFYWNDLIIPGNFNNYKPFKIVTLKDWTEFNLPKTDRSPSFGYATYRLNFRINKNRPHVSLYIPSAYSSSRIWINGHFFSEMGHVGKTRSKTIHRRFSQIIPLNTDENNFEIVIQVANYYHNKGGLDKPLILGASNHLHDLKSKRIMADMIFIGCLGFIGVFFLFFYLIYWNKDKAILYFAILCISLSYISLSDRYAPFTVIFDSISFILLTKFEYITLFLAGASGSLFFNNIFYNFIYRAYSKIIVFSFLALVILIFSLSPPHFTKLLIPFLILMIINLIYVTLVVIKAIIAKRLESILLLLSIILGSIIFYIHVFFFLGENGNAIIYVNFGYILVFLLLSMLLMKRFSDSFQELEHSKEIALQQKKEISTQSNQLSRANLELEENLKLLENYNAELDDFNHIVSHDLKTPLVSVHALVSFIEEDLKTTLHADTKNHINLLKDVVARMDALINGLLEYSKVAKGNKQKEWFKLNDLLHKVIGVVDNQQKNTIHLPDEDLEIYANKIELNHVFQNLLSNSIKYNDKKHTIIHISVVKQNNEYIFSVSDNGPGIDPKYHNKIFKMFSQLDVNEDVKSTGIGLAIVKKIISENYGIISIESEKGMGIKMNFSWRIK
ncbi:ATP-binding protein [Polaribacter sp. KT25b]|uniref:ATP-binding protein n=1 Tax=Polaribacter sp. KT25b TaxID=1855336 RepID=UPI000B82BE75|nr:ATP-binding protein [Polaribacter sp. KT25b]